jgi:hypothetical protein
MTKLYHKEIGLPDAYKAFCERQWNMAYTRHAMNEAAHDKLGALSHAPRSVCFRPQDVIEVEMADCELTKLVVRIPYDNRRDLILVLRNLYDGAATVITLWTNEITDTHGTLDRSKYATL